MTALQSMALSSFRSIASSESFSLRASARTVIALTALRKVAALLSRLPPPRKLLVSKLIFESESWSIELWELEERARVIGSEFKRCLSSSKPPLMDSRRFCSERICALRRS